MRILMLIFILLFSFQTIGENKIYKTVHADGTVTYSDQPSEGAIEITLHVNTSTINSNNARPTPQVQVTQKQSAQYTLSIVSPEADATIRNNNGTIKIAASIAPAVNGLFELSINQQTHRSASGLFTLVNMDRGSYSYSIKFIGTSGKVIASSEARELHLHKASVLINNSRNNP
ncbi:DUF4124 domain-containing protein [Glaciecola petra]|uniref:DUF4124 domain-containing protein n=1 Tax=Glaciecola petra TaxID=3075602 RepID=A0ABU2ZKW0_9ALTE|nr:DUF4124 domain-containing protein [Aestuariibacter sp. P117]MDT0593251.1 DUF4124 domain-containing protein [Aestuariibacter sp. P117]